MTHADRLLGIYPEAQPPVSRTIPRARRWLFGALLLVCVGCRIRDDVPPAPSASASTAPSVAPTPAVVVAPDAASDTGIDIPDAEPPPEGSEALAFAGLGTGAEADASLHDAIRAALASLSIAENAGSAAVAGVVILEDDPKLNAGTGVNLRIDGRTAEADAAVMVLNTDGSSHFAAVAAVEGVKNPVLVAEKLLGAPTPVLAGFWARDFAARVGITTEPVAQDAQHEAYRAAMLAALADGGTPWHQLPWATYVDPSLRDGGLSQSDAGATDAGANDSGRDAAKPDAARDTGDASADAAPAPSASTAPSASPAPSAPAAPSASATPATSAKPPKPPAPKPPTPLPKPQPKPPAPLPKPQPKPPAPPASSTPSTPSPAPSDTVAVLIRDANDRFAVAASSGGPPLSLPGRIGDVPVYGAGIFVGPHGAVAVTGRGELIVELALARRVYERLALTHSARISATWGIKLVPKDEQVGIAVLGKRDAYVARTATLAWLGWRDGKWKAPEESP
ncbi:MAG: isoaspartyl peptidase/L-asparaginase [Polyangiaceae bacterium]